MSYQGAVRRLQSELGELRETRANLEDARSYREYAGRPVAFFTSVLGWEPWSKQVEAADAIEDAPLTVLVGAQGVGKDALLSAFALYWTYARGGLVLLTAPTQRQVRSVLFGEIARMWHRADGLPGELFTSALRIAPESEAGIIGFTSTAVSNLTGYHGARVLGVLSEAQGLDGDAFEGLMSCAVGGSDRIVASGNPLYPSGRFYQAASSDGWTAVTIPAAEHPNIREGREAIPGGPSVAWVERMREEYGAGSNTFRSRVLSEFPDQGEESLFRRSWLDGSAGKWADPELLPGPGPTVLAVDPARFGPDSTAAALRRGTRMEWVRTWRGSDTQETAEKALELAPEGAAIVVDSIGIGAGVVDALRKTGRPGVEEFNGGERAKDSERYMNRRAESYWTLRGLLERGEIELPPDDRLFDELLATNWTPTPDGKVAVEPKEKLKARLGRSPDRADAVAMAFARTVRQAGRLVGFGNRIVDLETGRTHETARDWSEPGVWPKKWP